jgi:enamine deaminase RidA (YjgF/YER057c/UK114 family)
MKQAVNPADLFNPQERKSRSDPQGLPWSHGIKASGNLLFVSGQTATDLNGEIRFKGDILNQTAIALENLKKVVEAAGLVLDNVVQLNWYVTSAQAFYANGASALRRRYFNKDYPASTLVEVPRLANPEAMVEVQAIAVWDTE